MRGQPKGGCDMVRFIALIIVMAGVVVRAQQAPAPVAPPAPNVQVEPPPGAAPATTTAAVTQPVVMSPAAREAEGKAIAMMKRGEYARAAAVLEPIAKVTPIAQRSRSFVLNRAICDVVM